MLGADVMDNEIRHAVFIEPEDGILDAVLEWKSRIAVRWPEAAYLKHPAHGTIWCGKVKSGSSPPRDLAERIAALKRFRLPVIGPYVFFNDGLAGGQTLAYRLALTDSLSALQQTVCGSILHHTRCQETKCLPDALRQEPFETSWTDYGFPFVGAHWIPHFTVASLPVAQDDPIVTEFMSDVCLLEMQIHHVSWWQISGEAHDRLARFPLAL